MISATISGGTSAKSAPEPHDALHLCLESRLPATRESTIPSERKTHAGFPAKPLRWSDDADRVFIFSVDVQGLKSHLLHRVPCETMHSFHLDHVSIPSRDCCKTSARLPFENNNLATASCIPMFAVKR